MMSPITLPDLTGWVALITRGYRGLGLPIAVAVGERGANVARQLDAAGGRPPATVSLRSLKPDHQGGKETS
jgi:NAD(P)-dependent dehydrogenase (short-subunit alcohol dehydrogenase family)